MSKVSDRIAIVLSVAVLLFVAGAYISDNYAVGGLLALLGVACMLTLPKVQKRQGKLSYTNFVEGMLLEGKSQSNAYLEQVYPCKQRLSEDTYISTDGWYVVNALSYAKPGTEWAAKLYREHKHAPVNMIVLAMDMERKNLSILGMASSCVKILYPRELYKRLKKMQVLMPTTIIRRRIAWRDLMRTLSYKQAGLFALTAAVSAFAAIWSPIKLYYYIMASVGALLAVGTLLFKRFAKS